MSMEKQSIVVLGGSFNPPTMAHLKVINAATEAVHAEKGFLVPVSHAYLKRKRVKAGEGHLCISDKMRLDMLNAMFDSDPKISIYTEEMKEPFAITYQTMSYIQNIHPNANIFFAAGTDKTRLIEE